MPRADASHDGSESLQEAVRADRLEREGRWLRDVNASPFDEPQRRGQLYSAMGVSAAGPPPRTDREGWDDVSSASGLSRTAARFLLSVRRPYTGIVLAGIVGLGVSTGFLMPVSDLISRSPFGKANEVPERMSEQPSDDVEVTRLADLEHSLDILSDQYSLPRLGEFVDGARKKLGGMVARVGDSERVTQPDQADLARIQSLLGLAPIDRSLDETFARAKEASFTDALSNTAQALYTQAVTGLRDVSVTDARSAFANLQLMAEQPEALRNLQSNAQMAYTAASASANARAQEALNSAYTEFASALHTGDFDQAQTSARLVLGLASWVDCQCQIRATSDEANASGGIEIRAETDQGEAVLLPMPLALPHEPSSVAMSDVRLIEHPLIRARDSRFETNGRGIGSKPRGELVISFNAGQ